MKTYSSSSKKVSGQVQGMKFRTTVIFVQWIYSISVINNLKYTCILAYYCWYIRKTGLIWDKEMGTKRMKILLQLKSTK